MKIGNLEVYGVIYKITNKANGKVYIGQTMNNKGFRGRYAISKKKNPIIGVYKHHKYLLEKTQKGCNEHLLNSISKYGHDSWSVSEIFDVAFSKCELDIKEKFWISLYNSTNSKYGYNRENGGSNGKPNESTKKKMKNAQIKNGNARKVNQLSVPYLKIIKTYNSIGDATDALLLSRSSIKNVLNPNYQANTAGGYAWEYCDVKNIKYKNGLSVSRNQKVTKNEEKKRGLSYIVLEYLSNGKNITEISNILGIDYKKIYKIAYKNDFIIVEKQKDINKKAQITRKKVIELYLNGFRKFEIEKKLELSKSIVEKAIEKYDKHIVNRDGEYIKNK